MAIIAYLDGIDQISGSRRGITFDVSQAGPIAKRRQSPVNNQTNLRMQYRRVLKEANQFFWDLTAAQKIVWDTFAANAGIPGPWGMTKNQRACAAFFSCAINAHIAGDGFPVAPGAIPPIASPNITGLIVVNPTTVRALFNPSPAGAALRIYLRQALPGPGVRRWSAADGYIAEYSALNPNSPHDFTTKFARLVGWHGRYWVGFQNTFGGRSAEVEFDF